MPPRLSAHAIEQAARRGVPKKIVMDVAERPEQTLELGADREIRQSRVPFGESDYLVRVVVDRIAEEDLIVTVYRTSKMDKYWA